MNCDNSTKLYVALNGNDWWSGTLDAPNDSASDGPLATIAGAQTKIRELARTGMLKWPAKVFVRGGVYKVSTPITFSPEDYLPVTYQAYEGETPVISGGKQITGWEKTKVNGCDAWVVYLPEVASGSWFFRNLYVNGASRKRPKTPKEGFLRPVGIPGMPDKIDKGKEIFNGSNAFYARKGDIDASWKNLSDVEAFVMHWWVDERMPIASYDESTGLLTSAKKTRMVMCDDVKEDYARYWIENVFEALNQPGEWYLDRSEGKLYYIPMPGETPETAEVFAPVCQQLLKMVGDPDTNKFVEFVSFKGITFAHTDWRYARDEYAGDAQAAVSVHGAIYLEGARGCRFEDCNIGQIGQYGIEIADGCSGIQIVGCEISDLGGGGVRIGGSDASGPVCRRTGYNVVTDNHIHHAGQIYMSAVGVFLKDTFCNRVQHNHIHDLYYSGISCGWVWGYTESVSRENHLDMNLIHDLGFGLLSDMGGIYTLGIQPGTTIRGNIIYNVERASYGGWGVYLDEGSSHIVVEDNICYHLSSQGFHQHYGRENILRNNIFAYNREGQVAITRTEPHVSITLEKNIIVTQEQPYFAQVIPTPAGLPKHYSDLNLFWSTTGKEVPMGGNMGRDEEGNVTVTDTYSKQERLDAGRDHHSVFADPKFKSPETGDFSIPDDSPAIALGFRPIDTSNVGIRPNDKRD